MNLKILAILSLWYLAMSSIFLFGDVVYNEDSGFNNTIDINTSSLSDDEIDLGGFFTTGVSIARFVGWVSFGVGLPDDTPSAVKLGFILLQSFITLMTIGFIFSSIWDG